MCTVCCFTSWIEASDRFVNGELGMPVPSCQDLFSPKGCEALDALAEEISVESHPCVISVCYPRSNGKRNMMMMMMMFSEFYWILGGWWGGGDYSSVLLFIFILYNYVSRRPLERWQTWLNRVSPVQSTWSQWSWKTTIVKLSIETTLTKAQWLKLLNAQHAQQVWVVILMLLLFLLFDSWSTLKHWFMFF